MSNHEASAHSNQTSDSENGWSAASTIQECLWLVTELASELSAATDFSTLQHILTWKLRWLLDFDRCTLAVRAESTDTEYLLVDITSPSKAKSTPNQTISLTEGWAGKVLLESKPYFIKDLLQPADAIALPPNPHLGIAPNAVSIMLLPLRFGEHTIGSINFSSASPNAYSTTWRNLIGLLAVQIGGQLGAILAYQRTTTIQIQQVRELKRLNQLKDDFLSTVSHELRTPVTNMKMAIQMLTITLAQVPKQSESEKPDLSPTHRNDKIAHYLQILRDECDREASLINDLLDLQRLETGNQPLDLETICLEDWLPQVVVPFYERARNRQQVLQVNILSNIPSVRTDPNDLGRILAELLNNACKYTSPGEKIMVTGCALLGTLQLQVSNSGIEIPASELPFIFDRFYRVPSGDPWQQGGTGLGLALVQKLVERLGGIIEVQSQNQQTIFSVQLPI
jgi:signal transduction histidine kinase